jgi:hypothetical protein
MAVLRYWSLPIIATLLVILSLLVCRRAFTVWDVCPMLLELSLIKLPRLLIHSVRNIVGLFFSTLRSSYIHVGQYVCDVCIILMLFRHGFVRLEVPVCKVTLYIIS